VFKFFRRNKESEQVIEQKTEQALEKTRTGGVFEQIGKLFEVDDITDEFWDNLEKLLIQADIGYNLTEKMIEQSQRRTLDENTRRSKEVERIFRDTMVRVLDEAQNKAQASVDAIHKKEERDREWERKQREKEEAKKNRQKGGPVAAPVIPKNVTTDGKKQPYVILVVGVNGSGKTTSIAKLARYYQNGGASVVLGAADTFRAGAIDQLRMWSNRVNVPLVAREEGSDPAAVAFDTVKFAQDHNIDVAIIDTAGRLQTNYNLMEEMKKIERIMEKAQPGTPNETLLVLEATVGQNGLSQAKNFTEAVGVDGIVLTKLDGTAKGGIAFAIANDLKIPIKYIGTGEKVDDFSEFEPMAYVSGLFAR
jgi:fused signal recognition particle receptor